ncbi:EamA-like transporter family protein [uncultured archaeon]|nr:EamA-like transporter family protein [uncultured archaeon]
MSWIIYAVACVLLYGIMQFFIKLSSTGNNPVASSMIFITAQFVAQILLGAYFISKSDFNLDASGIKYGIIGGVAAAVATIVFFMALETGPLSKVVPISNMSLLVSVLLGVVFLGEAVNFRVAAGVAFAVLSIFLLTNGN